LTESSTKANPNESPHKQSSEETDAIDELRRLLVGPEQVKISHLNERFENPELRAQDVSGVLPEAIKIRSARDDKIAKVLEPSIENAIKASIKRDRRVLVDALFPVMGPAIRKAISSTILGMIQSFNQVLDHSFSIQGLKWRIEALKTNKPFAEVVLINTLLYQVEQIFFIHKDTGLVLQHVGAKGVAAQDPDLVSSMLTGIMDFVSDSFGAEKDESLDTLRIGGDRSVWVEQGPHALLAAVIRGTPPLDVRTVLSEMLDDLHVQQNEDLEAFQGDTTPFEAVRSRLETCLQF